MNPSKNAPCPCGSGKKYKRCCGQQAMPSIKIMPRAAHNRHCGDCTKCCDGWLKINIHGHDVSPGKPCPYSQNRQCSIYADRPEDPCRKFICGWLAQNSPLPDALRPDKAQWVMLPAEHRWRGMPVDMLVPAGPTPHMGALEWFMQFASQSGRPLLYQIGEEWFVHGPLQMQQELAARLARGEPLWELGNEQG